MSRRSFLWGMVIVLLVAAALRLAAFGQVPPGLYHDEAYHGLDVLDILGGPLPLYFPANNGREPLFIYLIAIAVGLLGKSPFALRLVAFPIGLLTVAATAAMGRALFSRRVGLLAAAVLAVTLWHVHLSRVGFRAVLLPMFIALTAWQVVRGAKTGRGRHWIAAGILYGLSFYSYTAARFTPVALVACGLYGLAMRSVVRRLCPAVRDRLWHGAGLAALAVLVTVAPLAVYTADHLGVVLGRPGQVFFLNPDIHGGDPWGTLWIHTLRTAGMFFVRGDRIWRHNVPWRPVFDPVLGIAFLVGFVVALRRIRREPAAGFVLIWTGVMSLPTLLAEDAPHFLRAVGMLPAAVFLPALGLDWLANCIFPPILPHPSSPTPPHSHPLFSHSRARIQSAILTLPLLFALGSTAWAYFGDYARDPMAGYWFEQGAVVLAGRVNEFLGSGWDGGRMVGQTSAGSGRLAGLADRQAYLDPGLWEQWPQVRFLVAAPEAVTVGLEGVHIPNTKLQAPNSGVAVFAWPYGDWQQAWALLPVPAEVIVEEGPLSQGDRDPKPYMTYLAFMATSPDPSVPALARFSEGVELLGVDVTPVEARTSLQQGRNTGDVRVRLRWRATAPLPDDYTVFLHYLRDGERIAQADSRPAGGYYPTPVWRPGDVVVDDHVVTGVGAPLPGHDVLLVGLWHPESGATLYLLDEAGNPAGDWIEVPIDGD